MSISKEHAEIITAINGLTDELDQPPSFARVALRLKIGLPELMRKLKIMRYLGYVEYREGKARSLRVTYEP